MNSLLVCSSVRWPTVVVMAVLSLVTLESSYAETAPCSPITGCKPPPPPPPDANLLKGSAKGRDNGAHSECSISGRDGALVMKIDARPKDPGSAGYAMCCVEFKSAIDVKVGDQLAADVVLQQTEEQLDIKVETANRKHVYMLQGKRGVDDTDPISYPVTDPDLGGDSQHIQRFCVAAHGPGALQTITVRKAVIAHSANGR